MAGSGINLAPAKPELHKDESKLKPDPNETQRNHPNLALVVNSLLKWDLGRVVFFTFFSFFFLV